MPLKSFRCHVCGSCCPKEYLKEGKFAERMSWLRNHRKRNHLVAFRKSIKKGVKARRK